MDKIKFENYLNKKTHISKGENKNYTPAAIQKRISSLLKVEDIFNFNIDSIIYNKNEVIELLNKIREKKLEDLKHTPLSNAVRHYYECMTGDKIDRIF